MYVGTAYGISDYVTASSSPTFAVGSTRTTMLCITVHIIDDDFANEGNTIFTVEISDNVIPGVTVGDKSTITIIDNEGIQ